ncbi:MAG: L-seryl-tRNA(Sec) selenium transferase [Sporanaerobacter sp.]|uniref:L-seryl-tRNA(Sec) selenium transferase n=1 Tax=Sporanaerobacter sp. TaxID=2010183 RepID=UPI003A102568
MEERKNLFSFIPKVDELLENPIISEKLNKLPRVTILDSIREELDGLRNDIKDGVVSEKNIEEKIKTLPYFIIKSAEQKNSFKLKRVVNATGVIIHTNLGRSLMSEKVMKNIMEVSSNYSNLEYDLELGQRGSRYSHLEEIITRITGGESAMVVNNNAAAVLLVLSTMAKDREVIVSRGELIEIGGSFRVPEVMEQSGAYLVDVGTTNKTHIWDYENAINENTAAFLKVHTSNYRILGFTSSVSLEELKSLKEKYEIPIVEDLGSGVLIDLSKYGLEYEPTVQDSIKNGVDVVTFSGDKLLGGPQAGIIVGKKEYIEKMKRNPLTRAFRVDKFTISALEATLKLYLDEDLAVESIPTLNMLTISIDELERKADRLENMLREEISEDLIQVQIEDDYSEVGGGSLPLEKLSTKCLTLSPKNLSSAQFEKKLRCFRIPIITRVYKDKIYFDLRTVKNDEFDIIVEGVKNALEK